MKTHTIRVDEQVLAKMNAIRNGKSYNQLLRSLWQLPEVRHNKPRKRRSRLVRIIRVLIK